MSDNDFNKGAEADLDPAIEHFRQKTAMTREQIDALSAEMRRRVFFITGLADLELIKRVQLSLAKSVENGETFKDWKRPGNGFSQESSRRNAAIPIPDLSPETDFRLFTTRTVRKDVFKPLSLR